MPLTFPAPDPLLGDNLAAEIEAALTLPADTVTVAVNGPNIEVDGAGSDPAPVQPVVDAHTGQPTAEQQTEQQKHTNVAQAVPTLRQWAEEARATTVTNGNNNAVTQTVVNRLGVFFDRFADLIESRGFDE